MEEMKWPEEHILEPNSGGCANCKYREAVPGYTTPLCEPCREQFIKYPIPLWIKLFAGGVLLVILFSLFTFPDHLSMAIHIKRGEKAVADNRYVTAKKEFELVVKKHPGHTKARGYLMLASFYNEDYQTFVKYKDEMNGVDFVDEKLLMRLQNASDKFYNYLPDTSFNIFGLYTYASKMYEARNYAACDSALVKLLQMDDTYLPGLRLLANSKRQSGDYNASIKYCERILEINEEAAYAYANLARTYLKQKRDREAMDMAQKSMSIDSKLPYNVATLALVYHFTNQTYKRDLLIKEAKASKDSTTMVYFQYVIDIIDQKEPFRN